MYAIASQIKLPVILQYIQFKKIFISEKVSVMRKVGPCHNVTWIYMENLSKCMYSIAYKYLTQGINITCQIVRETSAAQIGYAFQWYTINDREKYMISKT